MKTIILCGGRGWRLHEETKFKPKPMINIGPYPILLHIMNRYALYGYQDFILALGYKGNMVRDYFFHLPHYVNDVELDLSDHTVRTLKKNYRFNFKVSFVDTGENADTAERILKAARFCSDAQFLVSYGDDLSNVELDKLLNFHNQQVKKHHCLATITAAHPSSHFGQIWADKREVIRKFQEKPMSQDYVNGGYMVFEHAALDYLKKGETLEQGLERMASRSKLSQFRHEGFWHAMNTIKDMQYLNQLWKNGRPWTK